MKKTIQTILLSLTVLLVMSTGASAFTCDGLDFTDPNVCSDRGICTIDGCICNEGYTGLICEAEVITPVFCNGVWQEDPFVCSAHGVCEDDELCVCYEGYFGIDCERVAQCNGYDYTDPLACGDHGTCVEDGVCACDPFWYTQHENDPCDAELECGVFPYLFTGGYACNFRGECVDVGNGGIGECVCDYGYSGDTCLDTLECNGEEYYKATVCNGLGNCTVDGCVCIDGVHGDDCQFDDRRCGTYTSDQDGVCNRQGVCAFNPETDYYECDCYEGYYSDDLFTFCSGLVTCDSIPWDQDSACGEHGSCVDYDVCQCDTYYTGDNCMEQIMCNWVFGGDPNVCSGNGICTIDGECVCSLEWWGSDCQLPVTCGGLSPSDPLVCGGTQVCTPDGCRPMEEYVPPVTCFGVDAEDASVCSGNGVCTEQDVCICDEEFMGVECDTPVCIPSDEVCDGADNDCDGDVDEGYVPVLTTCGVGECAASGETVCEGGEVMDTCIPGLPTDEICDGADNDCDGDVDNGDFTEYFGSDVGACQQGISECVDGSMIVAQEEIGPGLELPGNDLDEDCDGVLLCDPAAEWKNHGKFVRCVSHEAEALLEAGDITPEERDALIKDAARSDIGKKLKGFFKKLFKGK